jgi:hydrogenase/urease accessory protein HupE
VRRERTSVGCAAAAIAAYLGALASLVHGYADAVNTACSSNEARAPVAFWPLMTGAVVLAVVAFTFRPKRKNEHGRTSGADLLAISVAIAVPLAAVVTVLGFWVTYGCWE